MCCEINCYEQSSDSVVNKIRKRQKEQEIAAELGNRTIAFTN